MEPEIITYRGQDMAIIIPHDVPTDGVRFFTPSDNALQIGMQHREKNKKMQAHMHRIDQPLIINEIQEVLTVIHGKIRVFIYTKTGKEITTRDLYAGDSVLLMRGGHTVEFLEDSRVFQIKQGPYPGFENAKIFFEDKKNRSRVPQP